MDDLILKLAEWAWGSDPSPEVSPEICLKMLYSFTIPSVPCLSGLITKLIGIAIISGACLNKAPIVYNILSSKSVGTFLFEASFCSHVWFLGNFNLIFADDMLNVYSWSLQQSSIQ